LREKPERRRKRELTLCRGEKDPKRKLVDGFPEKREGKTGILGSLG